MIDNLPVQTAQIYDYLSKGNFLCSNTSAEFNLQMQQNSD